VRNLECLEGCELQQFVKGRFYCQYYNKDLAMEVNRDIPPDEGGTKAIVFRCQECIDEGIKGIDQKTNAVDGIRKGLVYLGDHFYSFKDAFEDDLADLYRNLKKLEAEVLERKEDV
jgi:hypothetical protein